MKLTRCLMAFFVIIPFLVSLAHSAPFDTGFIIWVQPNNVTFTARLWGDEFIWRMETQDGYRIIRGGGGWYYYATLDGNGDYAITTSRVGIDSPPPAWTRDCSVGG